MRRKQKRYLLHAIGIVFLALLGPLGRAFGILPGVVLIGLAFACFVAAILMQADDEYSKHPFWTPYEVQFDGAEVRVLFNGKLRTKVAWTDIDAVGVRIDESFIPSPWWILFAGPKAQCTYPSEATGGMDMLTEMQRRLPGFGNKVVAETMRRFDGERLVWSKRV